MWEDDDDIDEVQEARLAEEAEQHMIDDDFDNHQYREMNK